MSPYLFTDIQSEPSGATPANRGSDFRSPSRIEFMEDSTEACVIVRIVQDNKAEEMETFTLTIEEGPDVQVGPTGPETTVVINDDDEDGKWHASESSDITTNQNLYKSGLIYVHGHHFGSSSV